MDINTVIGDINALVAESVQAAQAPLTTEVTRLNALIVSRDATIAARDATIIQITNDFNAYKASHPDAPAGDTTPPSVPTGLVATVASASAINLTWSASTDNVGVTGYDVYRNNVLIGSRVGTSYSDSGLAASTTYSYSVKAKDATGNVSGMSAAVTAKTNDVVTPPPPSTGWPDASTTGVRPGVTLAAYTGPSVIKTAGYKVTGKRITTGIEVQADGVQFVDCWIENGSNWGINGDNAKDMLVDHCTFKGPGRNGQMAAATLGAGVFTNNNVSGTSFGFNLKGKSTCKGNYIHDLGFGGSDPHYDGIMVQGGNVDTLIEDNFVSTPGDHGTAGLLIQSYFGNISNVTVNHNRFLGSPSYQIYSEKRSGTISGVKFTNNEMQKGAYGYWNIVGNTVVRSGNKDATTGANIDNA